MKKKILKLALAVLASSQMMMTKDLEATEKELYLEAKEIQYEKRWHLEITNAEQSHEKGLDGEGVKIAVIDTGVDYNGDFVKEKQNKIVERYDCTTEEQSCVPEKRKQMVSNHGTVVTSAISSRINGIAPKSEIISLRIEDENEEFDLSYIEKAYKWVAESDVDIAVTSVVIEALDEENLEKYEKQLKKTKEKGIIFFASAGNPLVDREVENEYYPASSEYAVAVGGMMIEKNKIKPWVSGNLRKETATGEQIDIVAPSLIYATEAEDQRDWHEGTSLSAPLVAGAFALLKQQFPDVETYNKEFKKDKIKSEKELNEKLLEIFKEHSIPMPYYEKGEDRSKKQYGSGLLQAIPYGIKGKIKLTVGEYYKHTKPLEETKTREKVKSGKYDYYQQWNEWYKLKDEEGKYFWVKKNNK